MKISSDLMKISPDPMKNLINSEQIFIRLDDKFIRVDGFAIERGQHPSESDRTFNAPRSLALEAHF